MISPKEFFHNRVTSYCFFSGQWIVGVMIKKKKVREELISVTLPAFDEYFSIQFLVGIVNKRDQIEFEKWATCFKIKQKKLIIYLSFQVRI